MPHVLGQHSQGLGSHIHKAQATSASGEESDMLAREEAVGERCNFLRPTLLLLEFKTCRCIDPSHQLTHCQQQHQRLIERLSASYNAKLVPVLIGHSGAIYTKHTLQSMEQLGIDKEAAMKCAGKMHIATVNQLHSIIQTRRHLEHGGTPQPGRPQPTTTARALYSGAHNHPGKRPKHRQGNHSFKPP